MKALSLIVLLGFTTVSCQNSYAQVQCRTTQTDAFCNSQTTIAGAGPHCCAKVMYSRRTSATAAWSNQTNYECLPVEFGLRAGAQWTTPDLTVYTYECVNTA